MGMFFENFDPVAGVAVPATGGLTVNEAKGVPMNHRQTYPGRENHPAVPPPSQQVDRFRYDVESRPDTPGSLDWLQQLRKPDAQQWYEFLVPIEFRDPRFTLERLPPMPPIPPQQQFSNPGPLLPDDPSDIGEPGPPRLPYQQLTPPGNQVNPTPMTPQEVKNMLKDMMRRK